MSKKDRPARLVDYLKEKIEDVPINASPNEYNFHCPFCLDRIGKESSKRKLGVNVKKGKAHCFRCDYAAHTLIQLIRDLNGGRITMAELDLVRGIRPTPALKDVRNTVIETLYASEDVAEDETLECPPLPDGLTWLKDKMNRRSSYRKAFEYLASRGVTDEQIVQHNIGYCRGDTHNKHLIFPVYQGGEMVYWVTRSIRPNAYVKSKNPKKEDGYYSKSLCLYNYDNVIGVRRVEIGEGVFDALSYPNGVCGFGKSLSKAQIAMLLSLVDYGTEEFVIGMDAGTANESKRIYKLLLGRVPKVSVLIFKDGDANDNRERLPELLDGSKEQPTTSDWVRSRLVFGR